jgi:hypothetical protein
MAARNGTAATNVVREASGAVLRAGGAAADVGILWLIVLLLQLYTIASCYKNCFIRIYVCYLWISLDRSTN